MQLPWPGMLPLLQVGSRRILVVDDEREIREVLAETLRDEGFVVQLAADGAEAMQEIEREAPDLVLLDMRMPRVDGWQFAQRLRSRGITVPIVVMTAARNAKAWAEEVGAVDFLAKPFDLVDLLDVVDRHLKS
jgi:CheY-like chemotaxis protein